VLADAVGLRLGRSDGDRRRVPGHEPAEGFSPDSLFLKELTLKGVYGHDFLSVRRAIELIESGPSHSTKLCTHTFH